MATVDSLGHYLTRDFKIAEVVTVGGGYCVALHDSEIYIPSNKTSDNKSMVAHLSSGGRFKGSKDGKDLLHKVKNLCECKVSAQEILGIRSDPHWKNFGDRWVSRLYKNTRQMSAVEQAIMDQCEFGIENPSGITELQHHRLWELQDREGSND